MGGIQFADGGWDVGGDPLTITGAVTSDATRNYNWIRQALTLEADATIASASDGRLTVAMVHLNDGTAGHGLTLGGSGTVSVGGIDGAGTDCSLTKTGEGSPISPVPTRSQGP